jgi:hypothetical protein
MNTNHTAANQLTLDIFEPREGETMRNRRKRAQREEVRKILAVVREELSEQRLRSSLAESRPVVHLDELFQRARQHAARDI